MPSPKRHAATTSAYNPLAIRVPSHLLAMAQDIHATGDTGLITDFEAFADQYARCHAYTLATANEPREPSMLGDIRPHLTTLVEPGLRSNLRLVATMLWFNQQVPGVAMEAAREALRAATAALRECHWLAE